MGLDAELFDEAPRVPGPLTISVDSLAKLGQRQTDDVGS